MLLLWILLALVALVILGAYISYRMAYFVAEKDKIRPAYEMPPGKIYEPYHPQMRKWMEEVRAMPHEELSMTTFDGLTLRGNYYEFALGAPIELMFHGYRGTAERDLCGGVQRAFSLGRSVLIVDQRAAGRSGGNAITFGVKEHIDCLKWIDFMIGHFGPEVKIVLCGISMGAATVLLAAGEALPEQVVGVLADCGYDSAKKIICKVIRDMKLPPWLLYPFVRLGGLLFAGFDPNRGEVAQGLRRCKVPVIFFHGDGDDFVPCQMSRGNFEACAAPKKLVIIPGAGHGLCYPADPEGYLSALREFAPVWGLDPDAHKKQEVKA